MVRSLVFAFPIVPRNYTRFDAANNLDPALERPLISLSGSSAKSPTHLGAKAVTFEGDGVHPKRLHQNPDRD